MTVQASSRAQAFDELAGALYCPAALRHRFAEDAAPLAHWRLLSRVIAVAEGPDEAMQSLKEFGGRLPAVAAQSEFTRWVGASWASWAAVLLLSPAPGAYWEHFNTSFPSSSHDEALLRLLAKYLLLTEGRNIYKSETLPADARAKYSEAPACILVKLGLALKEWADNENFPYRVLAREWQKSLQRPLLEWTSRQVRGFAPAWPAFEDFILAFLYLTEWQTSRDWRAVEQLIEGFAGRPEERMTGQQILMCAALHGWLLGYHNVNDTVHERGARRALSRHAMALAVRRNGRGAPPPMFYLSASDGSASDEESEAKPQRAAVPLGNLRSIFMKDITVIERAFSRLMGNWEEPVTSRHTEVSYELVIEDGLGQCPSTFTVISTS